MIEHVSIGIGEKRVQRESGIRKRPHLRLRVHLRRRAAAKKSYEAQVFRESGLYDASVGANAIHRVASINDQLCVLPNHRPVNRAMMRHDHNRICI